MEGTSFPSDFPTDEHQMKMLACVWDHIPKICLSKYYSHTWGMAALPCPTLGFFLSGWKKGDIVISIPHAGLRCVCLSLCDGAVGRSLKEGGLSPLVRDRNEVTGPCSLLPLARMAECAGKGLHNMSSAPVPNPHLLRESLSSHGLLR